MSYVVDDQATAIAAVIASVIDVGLTYNYQPVPVNDDWAGFVATFTTTIGGVQQVRCWTVDYIGEGRAIKTVGGVGVQATKTIRLLNWVIRGHLSWHNPDSGVTFRELLEQVVTKLDSNRSLQGSALDHTACQVELPNRAAGLFVGDVLCHYAVISLSAKVEQTLASV